MIESQHQPSNTSERDFLANRAADAKQAIVRNLGDMKETLMKMADVRSRAAQHPWIVTGSAAATGVVAGMLLTRSRGTSNRSGSETASSSLAEMPTARRERVSPRTTRSFLFSIGGTALAAFLRPLLQSWFASAAAAQSDSPSDAPSSRDPGDAVASEVSGVD
jgi:hypothetical protein